MKYAVMLCCLLFSVRAFAETIYFERHVTVKVGEKETGAKVLYVSTPNDEGEAFELTITPDCEKEEPIVISAMMKATDDEEVVEIYSADKRIGTGSVSIDDYDEIVNLKLEFSLFHRDRKVADVNMDKTHYPIGGMIPGLHLNVKLTGEIEFSFESDLLVDMAKTMRCSEEEDTSDC